MQELGRPIVTQDIRLRVLAEDWIRQQRPFAGLIYGHQALTIGSMVADLELIAQGLNQEDIANQVIHLPL